MCVTPWFLSSPSSPRALPCAAWAHHQPHSVFEDLCHQTGSLSLLSAPFPVRQKPGLTSLMLVNSVGVKGERLKVKIAACIISVRISYQPVKQSRPSFSNSCRTLGVPVLYILLIWCFFAKKQISRKCFSLKSQRFL